MPARILPDRPLTPNERAKRYYEKHKDKCRQRAKARRDANPEYGNAWRRRDRRLNPDKYKAIDARNARTRHPKLVAYQKEWAARNVARVMLHGSRMRAQKEGHAPICNGMDRADALAEVQRWLDKKPVTCECCGKGGRLTLDHCHRTGRIRAWLCHACNLLEGKIATGDVARLIAFMKSREA